MNNKIAVLLFAINSEGKVLSVTRKDNVNDYGLPGGKVEESESLQEALIRECKEETGLDIVSIDNNSCFVEMCEEYMCYTYKVEVAGSISTNESGKVEWVEPHVITSGSYGEYNLNVLKHLKLYF